MDEKPDGSEITATDVAGYYNNTDLTSAYRSLETDGI